MRYCAWALGNQMFATVENKSKNQSSRVNIWIFDAEDPEEPTDELNVRTITTDKTPLTGVFMKAKFLDASNTLIAVHDDGYVSKWDTGEEELIQHQKLTDGVLTDVYLTPDRGLALITSRDNKAYLIKTETFEVVKTYESDRPLNAAVISPILNHTLLAGGQDKHEVTLSSSDGNFEIEFWHTIYCERLESVPGHYGPVNSLAMTRDGKIFISGAEDGNVRLYHFDDGYFKCTY